jgi:hypothetical protein
MLALAMEFPRFRRSGPACEEAPPKRKPPACGRRGRCCEQTLVRLRGDPWEALRHGRTPSLPAQPPYIRERSRVRQPDAPARSSTTAGAPLFPARPAVDPSLEEVAGRGHPVDHEDAVRGGPEPVPVTDLDVAAGDDPGLPPIFIRSGIL